MIELYLRMLFALLVVLALIFMGYFVLKNRVATKGGDGLFRIIDYKSLGPKFSLIALQCGNKILVLALAPGTITLLKELEVEALPVDGPDLEGLKLRVKKLREALDASK